MKTFVKCLLIIFLAFAVVGLAVLLVYLYKSDDPLNEDTEFKVTYNGNEYIVGDDEYLAVLPSDGRALFNVSGTDDYTVQITGSYEVVNGILDFYYRVDGGAYLPTVDDYTEDFIMNIGSDGFVITCTSGYYDYETLLKRKWNASEVEFVGTLPEYPYKMVITSAEGEEITILLKQG